MTSQRTGTILPSISQHIQNWSGYELCEPAVIALRIAADSCSHAVLNNQPTCGGNPVQASVVEALGSDCVRMPLSECRHKLPGSSSLTVVVNRRVALGSDF